MTENTPAIQKTQTDITKEHDLSVIERVVMQGDLSKLDSQQRVTYYHKVCESLGLNPYTKPFDYISLNGKLQLYARKDATEQLRSVKNISITKLEGRVVDDLFIVKATATMPNGRTDESTGAVTIGSLKGDAKANAIMKAETKAKRRVTLSIAGLGWVDETEIETITSAVHVNVNMETGDIIKPEMQVIHNPETLQTITMNSLTSIIDHIPDAPKMVEDISRITQEELNEFLTHYVDTDDSFKEGFEKYIANSWNVKDFKDIPADKYHMIMGWIVKNIEMQSMRKS